jgi:hypothetical protein
LSQEAFDADLFGIATAVLGAVAILLAIAGVLAYLDLRARSAKIAEGEARKVAGQIAERAAVDYLQEEIPALMNAYHELAQNAVSNEQADEIAESQEGPNGGS